MLVWVLFQAWCQMLSCVSVISGVVSDPKVLGYCEAQYDYSPMETNQIAFKVGERIAILSKSRGNRGWWKGRLDGKVCSRYDTICEL